MYHSGVNNHEAKTVGRSPGCSVVLDDRSVSRRHATVQTTEEGYLAVQDTDSSNGTWLHRNGRWIRVRRVILGAGDRVRFGDCEVALERLVELFGERTGVRLREGWNARGRPLVFDPAVTLSQKPRTVLEHPRRNPLTGDIEENRQPPGTQGQGNDR
jgi:pSer/pThr/pTyr-binding forkhead associated (FHA) protein